MKVKIRKPKTTEYPDIVNLDKRCFKHDCLTMLDLWENRKNFFVMEHRSKIIGFYFWMEKGDNAYLASLDIDKPYRGKGLSKLLLAHFLKRKYSKHSLHVSSGNKVAITLYESHGFRKRHVTEDFYGDGASAIFMTK